MTWEPNLLSDASAFDGSGGLTHAGVWNEAVVYDPTLGGMTIEFPKQKSDPHALGLGNPSSRFSIKSVANSNEPITLSIPAGDTATFESPSTFLFTATTEQIVMPHIFFEWVYSDTQDLWLLTNTVYRDPRIGEVELASDTAVGASWTNLLTYGILQYGLQSFIFTGEFEWIAPGGNPTLDFSIRLQVGGVIVRIWHWYETDKPTSRNVLLTQPIWAKDLTPGVDITIDAINNDSGALSALGDAGETWLQLVGPFN